MALGVLQNLFSTTDVKPSIPLKQGKEPMYNDELAAMVNDEYKRRQKERMPFELTWRLNMEFIKGNQFIEINPVAQRLDETPKLYWYQEREVFNQIGTIYETRTARITRQKPIMKARPASGSDRDISAAKVSTMLLGYSWMEQGMDEKYTNFVSWLEATGTCFWKPVWNRNKGRLITRTLIHEEVGENKSKEEEIETPENYAPLFQQSENMVEIREGDIDTIEVSAFEIYPDSSFRHNMDQVRSLIHARAYHVDEIFDMHGVHVEPEEVDVITLQSGKSGLGGLGYAYGTFKTATTRVKNHAIVKEYYERPTRRYPQGRLIIVAGNQTLYVGTLPYFIGADGKVDLPFIRTTCLDNPGCFWGNTVVERLIPIQRRYNALRNRKAEYLNLVAVGQWYEPANSLLDETDLNNAPGNRIRYRPGPNGEKPSPVQWPSLPGSFENEESTLLAEFTAVSGVSELSRYSEAPSGVKSGVALSIANEQDDTRIANTTHRIAAGIIQLGKFWIRMYRQFVQEPRVLRWVGPNREVDVREWFASDLKSDDIVIENISALSETPSQRRQMIFDLIGTGIFNRDEQNPFDEEGRMRVMQLLEMGHWEFSQEDDRFLQKSRAKLENKEMSQGIMKPINDFDDHGLHIEMHNRYRMQEEYEMLLKSPVGPILDQLMKAHIAEHINALLQAQMAQQQQQMQMQIAAAAGVASAAPNAMR